MFERLSLNLNRVCALAGRQAAALMMLAVAALSPWGLAHADPIEPEDFRIEGVRVVGNADPSRLTIWMNGAAATDVFLSQTGNRSELIVDLGLPDTWGGPSSTLDASTGLQAYRWAGGQLAFTLAEPMMVARKLDLPPTGSETRHRLVLDLAKVAGVRFEAAAKADQRRLSRLMQHRAVAAAEAAVAEARARADDLGRRHIVVIDPGHGGKDPGATSVRGDHEKDIVLKAARELGALLEADPRFDVRLTRDDDRFIPLEQRVTLARDWGADLFISIHADAAAKPDIAGASVYTLAQRAAGRVERESERNNWNVPIEDGTSEEVSGILEDLVKRETKTNSGLFASMLIPHLEAAGPVLRNTHRNAGFYVLLAPDVPAVLVEIGFLTNRDDARRLVSERGRRRSVEALARSIGQYFDHQDAKLAVN